MDGYDATTYGQRWADVYDDWYGDEAEQAAIVDLLTSLASEANDAAGATDADRIDRRDGLGTDGDAVPVDGGSGVGAGGGADGGPIVELGIGTGLVALPLAARGVDVRGVDASPAMVERLRAKPGGDQIPVTIGDMADLVVPARPDDPTADPTAAPTDGTGGTGPDGPCRGVYVAANTFFGLATEADQRRCLERVHAVLAPGGWLVVAAFVPDRDGLRGTGSTVGVRSMTADQVVLTADRYDEATQTISGQYVDISAAGIVLRPFHIRYLYPDQLDRLAADAGLTFDRRYGGWDRAPFDEHATMHVSIYRR